MDLKNMTEEFQITIESPRSWERVLSVAVPEGRFQEEQDRVVEDYRRRLRVPGFRKGKIPRDLVIRRIGDELEERTIQRLVPQAVQEAVTAHSLEPITPPTVGKISRSTGSGLSFEARVEVQPEITVGRYTGFRLKRQVNPVTDEDVDQVVEQYRDEKARWVPLERPAHEGDLVSVEYGGIDEESGEIYGKLTHHRFVVGAGEVLPQFEEAVVGATLDEPLTVTVSFPPDHHREELRNTTRAFQVTVREVKEKILPPLDDDLANQVEGVTNLGELRKRIREMLEADREKETDRGLWESLIDDLLEANTIDVPPSMIRMTMNRMLEEFGQRSPEGQLTEEGQKKLEEMFRSPAERAVKQELALEWIAETEGIELDEAEFEEALQSMAERQEISVGQLKRELHRQEEWEALRRTLRRERVIQWLLDQCEIEEEKGEERSASRPQTASLKERTVVRWRNLFRRSERKMP